MKKSKVIKKSEACGKIYQYLLHINSPYHKGYKVIKDPKLMEVAKGILRCVESELGMLPPPEDKEIDEIFDEHVVWSLYYPNNICEDTGKVFLWEPEDE